MDRLEEVNNYGLAGPAIRRGQSGRLRSHRLSSNPYSKPSEGDVNAGTSHWAGWRLGFLYQSLTQEQRTAIPTSILFHEGYAARQRNQLRASNPYWFFDDTSMVEWDQGWLEANSRTVVCVPPWQKPVTDGGGGFCIIDIVTAGVELPPHTWSERFHFIEVVFEHDLQPHKRWRHDPKHRYSYVTDLELVPGDQVIIESPTTGYTVVRVKHVHRNVLPKGSWKRVVQKVDDTRYKAGQQAVIRVNELFQTLERKRAEVREQMEMRWMNKHDPSIGELSSELDRLRKEFGI